MIEQDCVLAYRLSDHTSPRETVKETWIFVKSLLIAVVVSLPQVYGRRDRGGSEKKAC